MSRPACECPGCFGAEFSAPYIIPKQPVILNYRFPTPEAAASVPRADVTLTQCRTCGLIFNSTFDPAQVPYDANYDNSQAFSPTFRDYLDKMAETLIESYGLRGKSILEVGCGKGAFLELICRKGNNSGTGYDTTYEGPAQKASPPLRFFQRYVSAGDIGQPYDAILCRHVIEHVPQIGAFLKELAAMARASGDPVTILETPSFEWIVENHCFWDLFNEHCNYFALPTLDYLCRRAGFDVVRQQTVFDGQYQFLELKVRQDNGPLSPPPGIPPRADLARFASTLTQSQKALEDTLLDAGAERGWAIWGAGAKGVALVNRLSIAPPAFVIDLNPGKQGCIIPGSNVRVISPEAPQVMECAVILVANRNYLGEIEADLRRKGYRGRILST